MCAIESGSLHTVKKFLDHGAEVNIKRRESSQESDVGTTALMRAVAGSHLEVVETLLERGADVNIKDSAGRSIAHNLARTVEPKLLRPFLSSRINWNDNQGA